MRVFLCSAAIASLLVVLQPATTHAQSPQTAVLTVNATVQSSCSLNSGTLDFGTYTSGQTLDRDVDGAIDYSNCSGTISFELDGGDSGDVNNRTMASGGDTLIYQLFRDQARSSVFGTGADAQSKLLLAPGSGSVDVYGRIPGGQNVAAGSYSDTINITLTF